MLDDSALLQRFALARAEEDFAELVQRHLNLVYSAALRQVGGDHQFAEEVTQSVFTDLARKAGSLGNHTSLAGWLYTSAHYAAAKMVRGEQRRRLREQEASQMQQTHTNPAVELDWEQLQPVIDEAMHALPEADREVILQRYFQRMPFLQIGVRHGLTENAARMRAERALDKLRGILASRGVSATAVALGAGLTAQAVLATPTALAGTIVSTALTAGTLAGAGVGGGLMTAAKLKVLIPSACAVALLVGVAWQQYTLNQLREENVALRRAQVVAIGGTPTTNSAGPLTNCRRKSWNCCGCVAKSGGCDGIWRSRKTWWQNLQKPTALQ
ncbi:MAG: sigma-70 family RNA polymerase sigma factor [Verrucomicrobiota bacterium]